MKTIKRLVLLLSCAVCIFSFSCCSIIYYMTNHKTHTERIGEVLGLELQGKLESSWNNQGAMGDGDGYYVFAFEEEISLQKGEGWYSLPYEEPAIGFFNFNLMDEGVKEKLLSIENGCWRYGGRSGWFDQFLAVYDMEEWKLHFYFYNM